MFDLLVEMAGDRWLSLPCHLTHMSVRRRAPFKFDTPFSCIVLIQHLNETKSRCRCLPLASAEGRPELAEKNVMTTASSLETRETTSLIGSDKVDGTAVYGADQEKIGSIERVMIDKISGKVAYAVLSFGGFMGMGEDYYPVPWSMLNYDTNLGGYCVNLTKHQLNNAPKYSESRGWTWDRKNDQRVYDYYKARPYWE